MSTTTQQPPKSDAADGDPFRLGRRYVRHKKDDGTEWVEQVPLTERDLLFPQEGDEVMHVDAHSRILFYLYMILCHQLRDRNDAKVLFDHRVDFGIDGVEPLGPDLSVFFNLPDWDVKRGTLDVAAWNAVAQLVIETTSPDTRKNDLGIKVDFYERAEVPYYAIIDLYGGDNGDRSELIGYRRTPVGYALDEPDERGWLWLEPLGLWLGLDGIWAVLYDTDGHRLGNYDEAVESAQIALKEYLEEKQAHENTERQLKDAERKLEDTEQQLENTEQQLENTEQQLENTEQQLEDAERQLKEQIAAKLLAEENAKKEAHLRAEFEARLRQVEAELSRRPPSANGKS